MANGGYDGDVIYLPLGQEGFAFSKNPQSIPPRALVQAESITYADDSIHLLPGLAKIGTSSTPLVGIYDWFPNEGQQFIVSVDTNGTLYIAPANTYHVDINPNIPAADGTPQTVKFVPCGGRTNGGRMLAVLTGVSPPAYFLGTSLVAAKFTLSPADWSTSFPVNGEVHNGRLYTWGVSDVPHALYGSVVDNHQDFITGLESGVATAESATYDSVYPGTGLRLYSGHSHKGLLFLFKYPIGVFYLDDTDINPAGWGSRRITDAMGVAPSPFASVQLDDGILFMSATGQFYLLTVDQNGITITDLSTRMVLDNYLQGIINVSRLNQMTSTWDAALKQAHFYCTSVNAADPTKNDLHLCFDFRAFTREEAKVRFGYSFRDAARSVTSYRDPSTYNFVPMFVDYSGDIWRTNVEDRSINSAQPGMTPTLAGYTGTFQIAHTNLTEYVSQAASYYGKDPKLAAFNKNWDWLGIEYVPSAGGSVTVTEYADGQAQPDQTVSMQDIGDALAASSLGPGFMLDTSSLAGATASQLPLKVKWVRLTGTSRRVSIKITTSGVASEDCQIVGFYLGYRLAGQDVGRGAGAT